MNPAAPPSGSAHGKAILIGEHAVVHGVGAIAMPVGMHVRVELGDVPASRLSDAYCDWFSRIASKYTGHPWVPARIDSDLVTGAGLGSSAALGVAALRALASVAPNVNDDLVVLADAGERLFHGNPSGIDVRAVLSQAPIWCLRRPECVTTSALEVGAGFDFQLWVTPALHSTAAMVARVSAALDAGDRRARLATAAQTVAAARNALAAGDPFALGRAMDSFHGWLGDLGASTPELDALVRHARAGGALGAKLTGAGGGGAVLVLWPDAQPRQTPAEVVAAARFRLDQTGVVPGTL